MPKSIHIRITYTIHLRKLHLFTSQFWMNGIKWPHPMETLLRLKKIRFTDSWRFMYKMLKDNQDKCTNYAMYIVFWLQVRNNHAVNPKFSTMLKSMHNHFWHMPEKVWIFWYVLQRGEWRIWLYTVIIGRVREISILTGAFMRFRRFAGSMTWNWRIFLQTSRRERILTGRGIWFW